MIKEGFKKDKLHVLANSLDYEKIVLQRNKAKSPIYINKFHNNNPTIFFIGRLGKNKKLELLIDAHKFAQEKSVNFNVVLIGDGEHKDYLLKKTKKLGTENNVWFYGACYDEILISELIYNADLCVSPGNVGLTVIHSLSFGTPVITHNNFSNQMPEFEAIEQGVTGDFFEENSIESLEQVITKWLSLNPSKTEELINRCYEIVDIKYNPNYQMSILSNVLINK